MSNRIITISREFGSGGRFIGKEVASRLGIGFFDKDIIAKVAEETGLAESFIEKKGEYAPGKSFFAYAFVSRDSSGRSLDDHLYAAQQKIILDIAEKESCVIVGRCADFILREHENCVNVFIHGMEDAKKKRIMELYGKSEKEAAKLLHDVDKKRGINYEYYTDQIWGKTQNYTLTLNSTKLGYEKCIDIICNL